MNNRLKINLIKERTLQRKNEIEGKQNSSAETTIFSNNNNRVFSPTQNNKEQYYQEFNQYPQNVDTNLLNRPSNNINENFVRPEGQEITSPMQPINPYEAYSYQQQQQQQQQISSFTNKPTETSNIKQQRQKAIATLRKRVEKNSPIESPPGLTTNVFPQNNSMQNMDKNIFDRTNNVVNIPIMPMSNNGIFEKEFTYNNSAQQNSNQQYIINNDNPVYLDTNNVMIQQNLMPSSPITNNNELKSKFDNKNPLAILSRRIEKSKMDHQEKNKMEIMDQRKQSLQILENRTNERMYNHNTNNTNDKAFDFFQQHKNNAMYTPQKYSPPLNNGINNGFQNPTLYSNQLNGIERNDSFSSNSSIPREGSGDIPTSPYDQYSSFSMNSRVSSVDSSRMSSLMLPEANNMARYSSLSSSSRFGSNNFIEEPQLFNNDYNSFSPQLYYQQQPLPNSSKSIIPSQRVPAQRVSSLNYSQDDIPQLGAIGNPINKINNSSKSNNISPIATTTTTNLLNPILNNSPVEPEQNIRQNAINTLLRRIKNNDGMTSPTNITSSPSQRINADNIYNNNNSNNNYNNNNHSYGTLNHYNNNNISNNNDNKEEDNNKKHDEIRKNLFAKLNNRINIANKESSSSPLRKLSNENSPTQNNSNGINNISSNENMTSEEKAKVRKSVINIIGMRTKKNESNHENPQNNILNIPLKPFERKFICKLKVNQILNLAMAKKRYIFVFNDALFLCKGIRQDHVVKYQIKNIFETKKLRFAMKGDDTILEEQYLNKNPIVKKAVSQFAVNPIKSLRFLFQKKLLHCSSISIALFLHCMPGISKRQLGFFIGMPEHSDILEAFIDAIPCQNVRLDQSLRLFLKTIRLPSDNDIINRIFCCFARIWYSRNEHVVSFDYIMTLKLVFTLISLNAELHPPIPVEELEIYYNSDNVEKIKQSFFHRFKNNEMISEDLENEEDDNSEPISTNNTDEQYYIPKQLLEDMYESILKEKIEVAPDNISLIKQSQDALKATFSYIPKSSQTSTEYIPSSSQLLEFPPKLYQNETSGVITVTLPHPNPYIQININTQELKVTPDVLTFENSNQAEFTVTASKTVGRKLLIFTKRLTEAASQLPLQAQRTILESYSNIDSKCIKVEPAFMKHSLILETLDVPDGGEKMSPLLSGHFHQENEEPRMNLKKYIFTVDSDRKVNEFIQSTKKYIGKVNEEDTTFDNTKKNSLMGGTALEETGEGNAVPGKNDFLMPPGKDEPTKLISRSNSVDNFSVLMYSDEINLNEEDQSFISRCNEAVPRNIVILREYFLPNDRKFNTIGRSLSTLKITDMGSHGYHYNNDVNSLRHYSATGSVDSLHDDTEDNETNIPERTYSTTAQSKPLQASNEEKSYEESQFINIILNQLLI
ncbi:hypothetical protein BCR36DRAFT_405734 [Piromyces finnis]|uniref:SEC7 domain-containing protein n=1 Tax=Piromyces finnis TaxID=1754191 RepID=A0A1Y1V504_9FUNG|nr:hypothetical protein BCR36DRAFT_405734 [Piromyces finnis]|eukprot:ORX46463.1 hypothetical protein BCR36DRAFT_405734 [Piromyces finnis]